MMLTLLAACLLTAEPPMTKLPLQTTIASQGKDRQVEVLFEGPRRKLVQITLRNDAVLTRHTAAVPITVQCIAGSGTFASGDALADSIPFTAGVLVTLDPNVPHEVKANGSVTFLLTQFTGDPPAGTSAPSTPGSGEGSR